MNELLEDLRRDLKGEIAALKIQAKIEQVHLKEFYGGKLEAFNYVSKFLDKWEKQNGRNI